MTTSNTFAFIILIATLFLYFDSYYYQARSDLHDMRYAKIVAGVTSILTDEKHANGPVMSASGYVITEDAGVRIFQLTLLFFPILSICAVWLGRKKYGKSKLDFKITFASVVIFFGIVLAIYRSGALNHA